MSVSVLTLRRWHRRLAVVLGVFLMFQVLTGVVAQQRFWLMQATEPAVYRADGLAVVGAEDPSAVLAGLAEAMPDFVVAHMMYPPPDSRRTGIIVMGGRDSSQRGMSRSVTVDPGTSTVMAERSSRAGWVGTATTLHQWLLFGTPGRIFLTLLGTMATLVSVLGILLWFRTRQAAGRARGVLRLHRSAGLVAGTFFILMSVTGVAMNLFVWSEKAGGRSIFANNMAQAHAGPMATVNVDATTALASARAAVSAQLSEPYLIAFGPPGHHGRHYWFAFRDRLLRRTDALVDPTDGHVVGVYPSGVTTGGTGLRQWLFPVHSGFLLGGWWGGLLFTVLGGATGLWILTGFALWVQRRRA